MSKTKYYAVKKGRNPGIYNSWDDCLKEVNGFTGAVYKSFKTYDEANDFMLSKDSRTKSKTKKIEQATDTTKINLKIENKIAKLKDNEAISFVDGSYYEDKEGNRLVGFGIVNITNNNIIKLNGTVSDESLLDYRNVTGEITAAKNAIVWAVNNNIKTLTIYYDYEGIKSWAQGLWKTNNDFTSSYKDFISNYKKDINVKFEKILAHSGIIYNEMVDELASEAIKRKLNLQ